MGMMEMTSQALLFRSTEPAGMLVCRYDADDQRTVHPCLIDHA